MFLSRVFFSPSVIRRSLGSALLSCGLLAGAAQAQTFVDLRLENAQTLPDHVLEAPPTTLELLVDISSNSPDSIRGVCHVRCRVDAGPLADSLVVVQLGRNGTSRFIILPLAPLAAGRHVVTAWVRPPAGYVDPRADNDSVRQVVRVVPLRETEPRLTLLEDLTSSTCFPCKPMADSLDAWLPRAPQDSAAVLVSYQQDFPVPGCYYATPSSIDRRTHYYTNTAPTLVVNGGLQTHFFTDSSFAQQLSLELARPALVHLEASYYRDPASGQLQLWGSLTPLTDFEPGPIMAYQPTINVAWVEPIVPALHATNGQRVLHQVSHYLDIQGLAPIGAVGTAVPFPVFTYTPEASDHVQDPTTLEAVVWASDESGSDRILQAVRARRMRAPLGLAAVMSGLAVTIVPNPAHSSAMLQLALPSAQLVEAEILDALGQRVLTVPAALQPMGTLALPLDVRGLRAGVYAVHLRVGEHAVTRRLVME